MARHYILKIGYRMAVNGDGVTEALNTSLEGLGDFVQDKQEWCREKV